MGLIDIIKGRLKKVDDIDPTLSLKAAIVFLDGTTPDGRYMIQTKLISADPSKRIIEQLPPNVALGMAAAHDIMGKYIDALSEGDKITVQDLAKIIYVDSLDQTTKTPILEGVRRLLKEKGMEV